MHFCWEAMVHAHLLWGYPMHIYCGTSHAFLLEGHITCAFIVGPYPVHFCWIIAHAHLMWDQNPCILVGRS